MAKPLKVGDVTANPGELKFGSLGHVELPDSTKVHIPVMVMNGAADGPTLIVQAVAHGVEMVGAEVIRRLMREKLDPKKIKGAIIAVPVANPLALHFGTRNTPQDEMNLNRVFPGNPNKSTTDRIAHIIWTEAITKGDYMVDLHGNDPPCTAFCLIKGTGNKKIDAESEKIAKAFGLTIVYKRVVQADFSGTGSGKAAEEGIPAITIELIDPRRVTDESIDLGLRGLLNVLKVLGMMEGQIEKQPSRYVWGNGLVEDGVTVYTSRGGIMVTEKEPGEKISEGEVIARIYNPYGDELEAIKMPFEGYIRAYTIGSTQVTNSGNYVAFVTKAK